MRTNTALLTALAATVLLLAGCGGDDGPTMECGGCSLPPMCNPDGTSPPAPCSCGCTAGEVFGAGVCNENGCLVPASSDAGTPGTDATAGIDGGGDAGPDDGGTTADAGTSTDGAAPADAARPEGFTVLTINLWNAYLHSDSWETRRDAIADSIAAWQPDVVCAQEAVTSDGDPNGAQQIATRAGYEVRVEITHEAFLFDEGIAALSRWPITASDTALLPIEDLGGIAKRAMLSVDLATDDGTVRAFCSHMSISTDETDKAEEAAAAWTFIDDRRTTAPAFFAGDLNAEPDTLAMQVLRGEATHDSVTGDLIDAWTTVHPSDPGFTIPSDDPDRRIDYVYVVPGSAGATPTVLDCERVFTSPVSGTTYVSDHVGVLCRFDLP